MNVVCFHNPEEENGYLSNWYPCVFRVDNITYSSMEQYMMYQKAVCFHDENIAKCILATDDAAQIKALGRCVLNYNDNHWSGVRQIVVYEGLKQKFAQNDTLREQLMATGHLFLAECAVNDRIWGIGLSMNDPHRGDINQWKGQNLLGYALMLVRDEFNKVARVAC